MNVSSRSVDPSPLKQGEEVSLEEPRAHVERVGGASSDSSSIGFTPCRSHSRSRASLDHQRITEHQLTALAPTETPKTTFANQGPAISPSHEKPHVVYERSSRVNLENRQAPGGTSNAIARRLRWTRPGRRSAATLLRGWPTLIMAAALLLAPAAVAAAGSAGPPSGAQPVPGGLTYLNDETGPATVYRAGKVMLAGITYVEDGLYCFTGRPSGFKAKGRFIDTSWQYINGGPRGHHVTTRARATVTSWIARKHWYLNGNPAEIMATPRNPTKAIDVLHECAGKFGQDHRKPLLQGTHIYQGDNARTVVRRSGNNVDTMSVYENYSCARGTIRGSRYTGRSYTETYEQVPVRSTFDETMNLEFGALAQTAARTTDYSIPVQPSAADRKRLMTYFDECLSNLR